MSVRLTPDAETAIGISVQTISEDLSDFDEVRLWVRSDRDLWVQPYTQSSGFVFRDGGYPDTLVPSNGGTVALRIRRDSMADPSMVQAVGLQVRPGRSNAPAHLELLAITALRHSVQEASMGPGITPLDVPSEGSVYSVYTASFNSGRTYENPYDPAEIDVQTEFELPSGRKLTLPAFWYQDYTLAPGSEKYEQYLPSGLPHWKVRFLPMEAGRHQFRMLARDRSGAIEEAGPYLFEVRRSGARGPVGRSPSNPILLAYASGAPYFPRGHNLCFEDGNPDLNGTAYYAPLLAGMSAAGENWTRYWMTDFARTALEWGRSHFSGFYAGAGTYSQRAAWRVDRFLELAAENGLYVQLVLNDHGQFSNYVNARWDSGNPYGTAEGGPVTQASPELFFSDTAARDLFRRRLRYVISRWSAYPNLLAWELWNEVQFAGSATRNFRSDTSTRSAIINWHREMSEFLKANDPFAHLVTTSSDDPGYSGWSSIWGLPAIDVVQSHHYLQPPAVRDARIREYVAAAQSAYRKPVVIGEMGVKASAEPECNFDPETFLTNSAVPAQERTPANRDHMRAGTTLRNGVWSGALSASGAMNWWWGCYMCPDDRRNRRMPEFPLHERLFPPLAAFWGGEDLDAAVRNAPLQTAGDILTWGLQGGSRAWLWVRDAREAYGTGFGPAALENRRTEGASVRLSGFDPGTYVVSLHETLNDGNVMAEFATPTAGDRLDVALPPFTGDIALKILGGTERSWGVVPRSARAWTTTDAGAELRTGYAQLVGTTGSPTLAAGAILTLVQGGNPTSDLMVPALPAIRDVWSVAEIGAPSEVGLAIANPGTARATVEVRLYDGQGRQEHISTIGLAPGEHTARFLNQVVSDVPSPFRGTVRLTSDVPVGALTLRGTQNSRGEFVLTTLPGRHGLEPEIHDPLVLAQVADGGGYRTEWLFLNPYDTEIGGNLRIYRSDGSPWPIQVDGVSGYERQYRIAPRGLARWISGGAPVQVEAGYSILVPESGPVPAAAAVIHFSPDGLMSQTGVPFQRMTASGSTYWESDTETFTGVAFANSSTQARTLQLALYVRNGIERVLKTEVELPAGRHVARLLTELFPELPVSGRGVLQYSSDGPVGFLALRIRGTPRGEKLTSSLAFGDLPGDGLRLLPQVVSGGGYSTRIVLVNGGSTTAEGRMAFRDPAGSPRRLLFVTR